MAQFRGPDGWISDAWRDGGWMGGSSLSAPMLDSHFAPFCDNVPLLILELHYNYLLAWFHVAVMSQ